MEKKLILTEKEIAEICKKLGAEITKTLQNSPKIPVVVGVMKGSMNFMMDLVRNIDMPIFTDYIQISSYNGTASSGKVQLVKDLSFDCQNRDVVIVEDIIDTGLTMAQMLEDLKRFEPKQVIVVSLFSKKARRTVDVQIDYSCFDIPDYFIVGYGLDYDQLYRNLPAIYVKE